MNGLDCLIPEMVVELLRSCGVDNMQMEWNIKGQEKGQPITLTMRWKPVKEERAKRKSPSAIRHETERTEKYFTRKQIEKSMDSVIVPKEERVTESETNSDTDGIKEEEEEESMDEEWYSKKSDKNQRQLETVMQDTKETTMKEPERKRLKQKETEKHSWTPLTSGTALTVKQQMTWRQRDIDLMDGLITEEEYERMNELDNRKFVEELDRKVKEKEHETKNKTREM